MIRPGVVLAGLLAGLPLGEAWAVDPFEIQIYEGEINDPGKAGLELHTNWVASGRSQFAFPGEITPDKLAHLTFEPSLGILPWWEVGAYLQFVAATGHNDARYAGFKLRSKFIAPRAHTGNFTLGVNFEIGRGVAALGDADWGTEVRPIVAYSLGRWLLAVNPIVGWTLARHAALAPECEPGAKIRAAATQDWGFGIEYYAGLGRLSGVPALTRQEHTLYAIADLLNGPIELNLGVGRGLTSATNPWTMKLIAGRTW